MTDLREQIVEIISNRISDMRLGLVGSDPSRVINGVDLAADAILALLPALPPGWVAVPEEPDMSMLHAALEWNRVQPADERPLRVGFEYHDAPAIYRAMLSARPALSTESGWQDIATAPRDGTAVDLWGHYANGSGFRFRMPGYFWEDGRWMNEDGEDASDYPKYIFQPTHWMPLPTPPTETER